MSKDKNNNRLDLAKFSDITKGTWEVIETPVGGIDIGVRYGTGHSPVVVFTQSLGEQCKQIQRDVADMNAIAAVPELIRHAELLEMAEAALREIWGKHIDCNSGPNVTEILTYYEKAHGLNIRPENED